MHFAGSISQQFKPIPKKIEYFDNLYIDYVPNPKDNPQEPQINYALKIRPNKVLKGTLQDAALTKAGLCYIPEDEAEKEKIAKHILALENARINQQLLKGIPKSSYPALLNILEIIMQSQQEGSPNKTLHFSLMRLEYLLKSASKQELIEACDNYALAYYLINDPWMRKHLPSIERHAPSRIRHAASKRVDFDIWYAACLVAGAISFYATIVLAVSVLSFLAPYCIPITLAAIVVTTCVLKAVVFLSALAKENPPSTIHKKAAIYENILQAPKYEHPSATLGALIEQVYQLLIEKKRKLEEPKGSLYTLFYEKSTKRQIQEVDELLEKLTEIDTIDKLTSFENKFLSEKEIRSLKNRPRGDEDGGYQVSDLPAPC
jgi:hypothetical protein